MNSLSAIPAFTVMVHTGTRPAEGSVFHVMADRPRDGEIQRGGAPLLTFDGDDYAFRVTEFDGDTSMAGAAGDASAEGRELAALEQALAGAARLGPGNGGLDMVPAEGVVRFRINSPGAFPTWTNWRVDGAPPEVLEVQRLAQLVAARYDGQRSGEDVVVFAGG